MASKFARGIRYVRKVLLFFMVCVVSLCALLLDASSAFWEAWGLICLGVFGANGVEHLSRGIWKRSSIREDGIEG